MNRITSALCLVVLLALSPAVAGDKKRESNVDSFPTVSLAAYDRLVIEDFTRSDPKAEKKAKDAAKIKLAAKQIPEFLATAIEDGLFETVDRGTADDRAAGTVILRGDITRFKAGSAAARAMMAGAGRAKIDTTITLVDASSGKALVSFPVEKLWAWGGAMGMSKGVDDLAENLGVELAMYLERCKSM